MYNHHHPTLLEDASSGVVVPAPVLDHRIRRPARAMGRVLGERLWKRKNEVRREYARGKEVMLSALKTAHSV
jgi:hypothetical protein